MIRQISGCICLVLSILILIGCNDNSNELKDGYYTAEVSEFDDYGWKEFITIYVSNNKIVTVEYNAKNASGLLKSWDIDYMRKMKETDGTYPNAYTRTYSETLLDRQSMDGTDAIAGATHSYDTFCILADAVINHAKTGDKSIAYVDIP